MFKMALLLVLLCMSLVIVKGEGSHCMATTNCGAQHGLSLYLRVCCVNSNLGQTVHMRENNSNKHILCPSVRPRSCLPGKLYSVKCIIVILNLVDKDCKTWFEAGNTTSGVYTINPDEQTPFEVRG